MENPPQNSNTQNSNSQQTLQNQSNKNHEFKPSMGTKLKSFMIQSKRVWHILKKPTSEEFKSISKISALGILAIGALGFIIADVIKLFIK